MLKLGNNAEGNTVIIIELPSSSPECPTGLVEELSKEYQGYTGRWRTEIALVKGEIEARGEVENQDSCPTNLTMDCATHANSYN